MRRADLLLLLFGLIALCLVAIMVESSVFPTGLGTSFVGAAIGYGLVAIGIIVLACLPRH